MTLRLLLDEDTERALAPKLTEDGHDVERVATVDALGTGSDDREVCEYALETDRIVVSHDDDFLTHPVDAHAACSTSRTSDSRRTGLPVSSSPSSTPTGVEIGSIPSSFSPRTGCSYLS